MNDPECARTVWFHRAYRGLTGGELKHAHYFAHTREMPGFAARIAFTGAPLDASREAERRRLWPVGRRVRDTHESRLTQPIGQDAHAPVTAPPPAPRP